MPLNNYGPFPMSLPVIVEDEQVLYPFIITPLIFSDENNIANIAEAVGALAIIVPSRLEGSRDEEGIYPAGVVGTIMRATTLPDGRSKILFQGHARARILSIESTQPLHAHVDLIPSLPITSAFEMEAILTVVREKFRALTQVDNNIPNDMFRTLEETNDYDRLIDLICSVIKLKRDRAYELFIQEDPKVRAMMLIDELVSHIESSKLKKEIRSKAHNHIEKVNKEYFLKEQLKEIQKQLGTDNAREEEIEEFRTKLEAKKSKMDPEAYKEIHKQLERFARMHPDSADASMLQTYLEWVLEIPFGEEAKKALRVDNVETQLNKDHFSLKKPKSRIVEYFSVKELLELRGLGEKEGRGAILCFAGPPGVGKTSLANSIATALKRPLVRIALGGLEDVNELRGHRRTYIGAMPGRIVQGLIEAKKSNPVMVLDEIDKVSASHRGDPTAVLLEILDPEQNTHFRDYYLNFNIDLSKVIFIATANDVGRIPGPLRDRMEFITVSSYTPQEKFQIAKQYLLPQELKKHGLKNGELSLSKAAMQEIIEKHTREAGVRNLRRRLADIVRKVAKKILEDPSTTKVSIGVKNLKEFLDKSIFEIDRTDHVDRVGVVNGLAWTAVGGDVLKIEAIRIHGKGSLQLTGSLGDVMKESARIAFSVVKTLIDTGSLSVDHGIMPLTPSERESDILIEASEIYKRFDLHLHVPDGATPKDGPSAGIAMSTVIASILTNKKVRADIAMTGEVSLTGNVLPIGGLKEKLIAAHRAGMKLALIPQKNYERDLVDIPDEVKNSLEIRGVSRIEEVLSTLLIDV